MKIISVVGARPNFMKIAPFIHEVVKYNNQTSARIEHILVHAGQHYDDRMSKAFFEALSIPEADINMGIGSGMHAMQEVKPGCENLGILLLPFTAAQKPLLVRIKSEALPGL